MAFLVEPLIVEGVMLLIKGLMTEVVKPIWNLGKNARALKDILDILNLAISEIDKTMVSGAQTLWLDKLKNRLIAVQDLFSDMKPGKRPSISKSKDFESEMKGLREFFQDSSIMGYFASLKIREEQLDLWKELDSRIDALAHDMSEKWDASAHDARQKVSFNRKLRRQDTYKIFGREQLIEEAKSLILMESNTYYIGLHGMGGCGKTLTAEQIYNDSDIQAHFTGGCYWLTVGDSMTSKELLLQLHVHTMGYSVSSKNLDEKYVKNSLFSKLRNREKIFLVLDDVWKGETPHMLDVLPYDLGCKVLITTRNEEILDKLHACRLKVPGLTDEDSWKLFCEHAFGQGSKVPKDLEEIARKISRECDGLPLALKVIGGVFAGKRSSSYWKHQYTKLTKAVKLSSDHKVQLYSQLKLSVDDLKSTEFLNTSFIKDCFFYFVAFPEDFEADLKEDLLPLLLGEQIVGNDDDYDAEAEAWEMLESLKSRSLIEGRVKEDFLRQNKNTYRIHDVLRDLVNHMLQNGDAMLQNLPIEKRDCLYIAGHESKCFPQTWVTNSKSRDAKTTLSARRMSLMKCKIEKMPLKLLDAPEMRVLILRDNPISFIPDDFFCNNLENLKVLDVSLTAITSLPNNIGNLKHLVVLNLSMTMVEELPSSIGDLSNLEWINLKSCSKLQYLPSSFFLLSKLKYFNALGAERIWMNTKELENNEVDFQRGGSMRKLQQLVALKYLHISNSDEKIVPDCIFEALKELQELCLKMDKLRTIPDLYPEELQHLQILTLRSSHLNFLPSAFGTYLVKLHTLNLEFCDNLLSLPALDSLPKLTYMLVFMCESLGSLPDSFGRAGAFPVLKQLTIYNCPQLRFPEVQQGAMPHLERISLDLGQKDNIPISVNSLNNLRTLQKLFIRSCSYEVTQKLKDLKRIKIENNDPATNISAKSDFQEEEVLGGRSKRQRGSSNAQ